MSCPHTFLTISFSKITTQYNISVQYIRLLCLPSNQPTKMVDYIYPDTFQYRGMLLPVSTKKMNFFFSNLMYSIMTNCKGVTSLTHSFEYSYGLVKECS